MISSVVSHQKRHSTGCIMGSLSLRRTPCQRFAQGGEKPSQLEGKLTFVSFESENALINAFFLLGKVVLECQKSMPKDHFKNLLRQKFNEKNLFCIIQQVYFHMENSSHLPHPLPLPHPTCNSLYSHLLIHTYIPQKCSLIYN